MFLSFFSLFRDFNAISAVDYNFIMCFIQAIADFPTANKVYMRLYTRRKHWKRNEAGLYLFYILFTYHKLPTQWICIALILLKYINYNKESYYKLIVKQLRKTS